MKKWQIGLILLIIGFVIFIAGFMQTSFSNIGSQQTCYFTSIIGGILMLVGTSILAARFRKWSSE